MLQLFCSTSYGMQLAVLNVVRDSFKFDLFDVKLFSSSTQEKIKKKTSITFETLIRLKTWGFICTLLKV